MSRPGRAALLLGVLLLVLLGLAGSVDVCASRASGSPKLQLSATGDGPLLAGAASRPLEVPLPAVVAGYGIPRARASAVAFSVRASALVVEAGRVRVGLVTLDVLVGDAALEDAIRQATVPLGLTEVWVAVTHTHSGPGGYASNPVAQVAGTGLLHSSVRQAVVAAAAGALRDAFQARRPVSLRFGEAALPELVGAREMPQDVDARLSRLVFDAEGGPLAQLLVFACHPTLVPRPPAGLDSDWPGRLAEAEAASGHGVTLVLQGAVGNVSPALHGDNMERLERFVSALAAAVDGLPLTAVPAGLSVARVSVRLPGPDAERLVPRVLRPLADNVLCAAAPSMATVGLLHLGPLTLLGVPAEPSAAAGRVLQEAAGARRVVSLVNGYLGYVETPGHLERREGEAERQLLGAGFLDALAQAARAARDARL
ncbi:MAG: neutral/alkaline non-lysosomal ceramidase N-terminal domain-containing protein [Myxococcaceae bacterium]